MRETIASGVALFLFVLVGVLSYWRLEQEEAARQWVSHNYQIVGKLDVALASSVDLDPTRSTPNKGSEQDSETIRTLDGSLSEIRGLARDIAIGKPTNEPESAMESDRFEHHGWSVREDGSRFWANVVVTPLQDQTGHLRGFVKITRDTTEALNEAAPVPRRP